MIDPRRIVPTITHNRETDEVEVRVDLHLWRVERINTDDKKVAGLKAQQLASELFESIYDGTVALSDQTQEAATLYRALAGVIAAELKREKRPGGLLAK